MPDLTRNQVCKQLNCSKAKFYKLLDDPVDPLPAYKLGDGPRAEWRVPRNALAEWIERRKHSGDGKKVTDLNRKKGTQGRKPVPEERKEGRWKMNIPEKKQA